MKIKVLGLFCLLLISFSAVAQSKQPARFPASPDGFRDLVLNKSTVDDVIKSVGEPNTDKTAKLDVSKLEQWLDAKHREKVFRQLTYKKIGDFSQMELSFLDDKLVMIDLEFKRNLSPTKLTNMFAVGFAHLGGPASLPDKPGEYPIAFSAVTFPPAYTMVGVSNNTFILVNCSSEGQGTSPGRVNRTRQVSRLLERK